MISSLKFTVTCLFLSVSFFLFSQENDLYLEEIIISEETENDLPELQINLSEMHLFRPGSTGELFGKIQGMNVMKRSKFAVEPSLRMFKREQLNLMIDGGTRITHSCANRMDAMVTRLSAAEIEKIEIIQGPYSVRFGQSMGGIINIITKKYAVTDSFKIKGGADLAYETNGSGISSGLEFGASGKKFYFLLSGTFRDFDDYTSGNDSLIIASFTAYDYSAKAGYKINDRHKFQLSFRQSFAKDVMHAGLPMDALNDDGKLLSVDYHYSHSTGKLSSVKCKFYGSDVDHLMSNEFKKNFMFTEALASVQSQTFGGKTELNFTLHEQLILFTGIDFMRKSRDGERNRLVKINACTGVELPEPLEFTDKIWQNSRSDAAGVFAEIHFIPNTRLKATAGIRNNYIMTDITDPADDFSAFYEGNITPEDQNTTDFFAKLNFNLPAKFGLTVAAGKSSRTPSLSELFINHLSVGQDAYEYLGNPELKAEKNHQADIVFSHGGNTHFVYANVFYSYIRDFITASVDTTIPRKFLPCKQPAHTKQFVNADEVYQYGLNAGFHLEPFKHLIVSGDLMYTRAQNISTDEPLPEISPLTVKAGISCMIGSFTFYLGERYAAAQNRVAESFGEVPSEAFSVTDINIFYAMKHLTFGFALDNIFDTNYYEHTSRAYKNLEQNSLFFEPGRNFKCTVKFYF